MFVIILKFSVNKSQAGTYMSGHTAWLERGFDEGVFLLAGTIQPGLGGALFAHNASLSDLQSRISDDPFVAQEVVSAEILEITPGQTIERLDFLLDV
ncbi:MAG: hypothetical protein AB2728_14500 [Candidatus Thiodiazotropha sp.]|nr:MAG: hypothetical protein DBO99_06215 [gamma proteobacterium symbiont of Ctena orbiculata]